jgi:GNAT superfamily N-acetyltransferase
MECAREFTSIIPDCPLNAAHYGDVWRGFLNADIGAIFLLEDDNGNVVGGIGGVRHPDLLTGRVMAVEMFWYVREAHRMGMWPVRLLVEYERWAKSVGCYDVAMIHMECSMPERLKEFYTRRGYRLFETIYRKVL